MLLNLQNIIKTYKLDIKGVIHIGGYVGEEATLYRELGINRAIFFEPQKHLYEILKLRAQGYHVFNIGLGNFDGTVDLNVSHTDGGISNGCGASSSILAPKKHLEQYPHIRFDKIEQIKVRRLDDFLSENHIKCEKYNFLNIDVQGYELEVLRGSASTLSHIDGIICEVNRAELYEGCPFFEHIVDFLEPFGFEPKIVDWSGGSWGDCYFHRG